MSKAGTSDSVLRSRARIARDGVLACILWLAGCASPPGIIFDPAEGNYTWPPPPDSARIRYVGQLRGEADLRVGRSGIERLGDTLFGTKPKETFVSPLATCTDGAHTIFIADSNAQAVHVLDLETRAYKRIAPKEPNYRFALPVAVVYDPAGRLLVADSLAAQVVVFSSDGTPSGVIRSDVLERPCGLAFDAPTRRLFVADSALHQIFVFDETGTEIARIGRRGSEPGEFNFPTNVALDAEGRLYVSDSLNFRVQVFDQKFKPIRQIGTKGDMPGYFSQPKGVAIDPAGHVYVVDANFEAVQIFDADGKLLMSFGREGQGPGEFWLPVGIFIDRTGRIWVADSYNRRVQVFDYLAEEKQP